VSSRVAAGGDSLIIERARLCIDIVMKEERGDFCFRIFTGAGLNPQCWR
jgi:hypothetical protein